MGQELLIIAIRGIGLGATYALLAMSFNVVYSSSRILNFAQGNLFALGGLVAALLLGGTTGIVGWLALAAFAAALIGLAAAVQGWITLLPLRHSVEQDSWLITTMAASVIIGAALLLILGPSPRVAPNLFGGVRVVGMRIPASYPIAAALALLWYGALQWFMTKSRAGLAISAVSQDLEAARAAGLDVQKLQLLAFLISGLIIGSAGFVLAPLFPITSDSGFQYVLSGFIAATIGGMGSNTGALLGGALVGLVNMFTAYEVGGDYQSLVSVLLLAFVLVIRPTGLLGQSAARQV